jgi:hypothetical protein
MKISHSIVVRTYEAVSCRSISSLGGSAMTSYGGNMTFTEKTAIAAVIGGTAEALGGGKFANGAVTGAFVMAYNHLMEQGEAKNQGRLDWTKTPDAEKIQILLLAAKKSGYIVDLNDYFTNIQLHADSYGLLETSLGQPGFETDKPVTISIDGQQFEIYFSLAIPVDMYGNINSPNVNLGIKWTVNYSETLKFGPGQPFPGSTSFFRIVIYGPIEKAELFWDWYME